MYVFIKKKPIRFVKMSCFINNPDENAKLSEIKNTVFWNDRFYTVNYNITFKYICLAVIFIHITMSYQISKYRNPFVCLLVSALYIVVYSSRLI